MRLLPCSFTQKCFIPARTTTPTFRPVTVSPSLSTLLHLKTAPAPALSPTVSPTTSHRLSQRPSWALTPHRVSPFCLFDVEQEPCLSRLFAAESYLSPRAHLTASRYSADSRGISPLQRHPETGKFYYLTREETTALRVLEDRALLDMRARREEVYSLTVLHDLNALSNDVNHLLADVSVLPREHYFNLLLLHRLTALEDRWQGLFLSPPPSQP
jgi:hypothetical protein